MPTLEASLAADRRIIEKHLRLLLKGERGIPLRLREAMGHSLLGGGKRLRPLLLLWTWDAVALSKNKNSLSRAEALRAACALEMLHTYSLIHDDLPAMDDDVLRRGRPTCHVAFDEPTAILAGDALQARAFEVLAEAGGPRAGMLVQRVAQAIGPAGMVGGQQDDLDSEGQHPDARLVKKIHLKKTAALLGVSFASGALLAGASQRVTDNLFAAGEQLGLAFQGADDLLDVTATSEELGKSPGKEAASGKATWVRLEGLEKARLRTAGHGRKGLALLEKSLKPGPESVRLAALGAMMWNRDR